MKVRFKKAENAYQSVADLFAGLTVAILLILLVIWIQALNEAVQIRKLKNIQKIFDESFQKGIGHNNKDIEVNTEKGEIVMKTQGAFKIGDREFNPGPEVKASFLSTRNTLAVILDDIEQNFHQKSDVEHVIEARNLVEILVVGHTDCIRYTEKDQVKDNWDLSVLRATAIAKFFSEACQDGQYKCCEDGSQSCEDSEKKQRIDPKKWRILPAGRGEYEPTKLDFDPIELNNCHDKSWYSNQEPWLAQQRRVAIQLVLRTDKILIQNTKLYR